jgi:chromosome segregation ATPase
MGRKVSITDEQYNNFIISETAKGRSLSDITPTEVFKSVGGTFSRASGVLEEMQDNAIANSSPGRELPAWFIEWKKSLITQVEQTADSAWSTLGSQIDSELVAAKDGFDVSLAKLQKRVNSRDEQIAIQEQQLDELTESLETINAAAATAATAKIQQDLVLEQANQQLKKLELKLETATASHEKMLHDLATANSTIKSLETAVDKIESERNYAQIELRGLTGELATALSSLKTAKDGEILAQGELKASEKELLSLKPTHDLMISTLKGLKVELQLAKESLSVAEQEKYHAQAELGVREREISELKELKGKISAKK